MPAAGTVVRELAGGLGDIGTLAPILVSLILLNGVPSTPAFLGVGVAYLATAAYFRLPVPVQPLKALAVIAIATGAPPARIQAAALVIAAVLLAVGVSGQAARLSRLFPRPVVRGIQAAVGLLLVVQGAKMVLGGSLFLGAQPETGPGSLFIPLIGVLTVLAGIGGRFAPRMPVALLTLGAGALAGLAWPHSHLVRTSTHQPLTLSLPSASAWWPALVLLVVPQLPVTLGNAVVAARLTARDYFAASAARVTEKVLCVSMGAANVLAGLLGGVPVCHGSGGFTAHYRFGARSGLGTGLLGAALVVLALADGTHLVPAMTLLPVPILGGLLAVVGLEHLLLAREALANWRSAAAAAVVPALTLAFGGNVALGFAGGVAAHLALRPPALVPEPAPACPNPP